MNRYSALIPAALAALNVLSTSVPAQKVPSTVRPSFDIETGTPAAPPDDATRQPLAVPRSESAAVRAPLGADAKARAVSHVSADELPFPLHDVDEHGKLWVRGRTYKAGFGADGATYVPFLGSRAPRNFPVRFGVSSVTSGGAPLSFDAGAPARREGEVVAFDRGSFVEQYAISAESIEQRFVFDALPSRGEIVVSIDVASELAGRADADGFRFENELGRVRYGRAFALDARGTKVGIESRLEGGRIQLVVPQAFVAQAELPLVIDPYAGTIAVDVDAESEWQADVAYDSTTNSFLVVYEDQFSATDHDVYGRKYVDQVLQGTATIDFTTDDWRNPKVANNNLADHFLCVAQVGVAPTRIIRGRFVLANTLGLGSVLTISGPEVGDKFNPDVGGDPATVGPTYHCVVYQREDSGGDNDIHARMVGTGGGIPGPTLFLANSTTLNDEFPSISKTDGLPPFASQNWQVVWQHETSTTNDDIQGARILWDGTVTDPAFFVASTTENERAPAASEPVNDNGAGRPWLAVYTIGSDLRLRVFDGTAVQATSDITAGTLQTLGQPVVTTDGRKFPFAYTSTTGVFPSLDTDLAAGVLNFIAGQISYAESTVVASSSTLDETRPEIASSYTATLTGPWRNYVTYDEYNGSDYDVRAAVYDTPTNAGGYLYCNGDSIACPCANGNNGTFAISGCANSVNQAGAHLDVAGVWSGSQDSTTLVAQGMPATTTCLFFQGNMPVTTTSFFGDGARCAGSGIVRLGTKTASAGVAAYGYPGDVPIHTRGLVPVGGGWRYYQAWYRNAAAFCTSSTFNLSNAAALLWSP